MQIHDAQLESKAYFPEKTAKDMVVLHFTAGANYKAALATFAAAPKQHGYPISVQYVVAEDGDVYQCFPEACWSYHLGVSGAPAANHRHDKRSIAIEICNVGPLRKRGETQSMYYWPMNFHSHYCNPGEVEKYVELTIPFRNEKWFATFTKAQIETVPELVAGICERWNIPKVVPPAAKRHDFAPAHFRDFKGVTSHVNWRADKSDWRRCRRIRFTMGCWLGGSSKREDRL